jgi:hypothetical protein
VKQGKSTVRLTNLIETVFGKSKKITPCLGIIPVVVACVSVLFLHSPRIALLWFAGLDNTFPFRLSMFVELYNLCRSLSGVPALIGTQSLRGLPLPLSLGTAGSPSRTQPHHAATFSTVDKPRHLWCLQERFPRLPSYTFHQAHGLSEQQQPSVDRQASDCACPDTSRYSRTPRHQRNLLSTLSVFRSIRSCFPQRKSPFALRVSAKQRGKFDCISDLLADPSNSVSRDYTMKLERVFCEPR